MQHACWCGRMAPSAPSRRRPTSLAPIGQSTRHTISPPQIPVLVLAVFAWLCATPGAPAQAQGVAGLSLQSVALPTAIATPVPTPAPSPISAIYGANPSANSLSIFPTGSSGNVASLFAQTQLDNPKGIAYSGGYLYVANQATDSITVYPAGANGAVNPVSTISGDSTQLDSPGAIAIDSAGSIYVANRGSLNGDVDSIAVYPAGSNGNVAPNATITGPNTGLAMPISLALDSQGNIYVGNEGSAAGGQDSITVYSPGSNGNITPARTISGPSTGLVTPMGIAVDSSGYIYVSSASGTNPAYSDTYVPSAGWSEAYGLFTFYGPGGNEPGSNDDTNAVSILIYAPGSDGDVAPITSIDGDCAILNAPGALAFANGQLYVTNPADLASGDESVVVYNEITLAPTGPQCLTPTSLIFGPNTGINQPFGIAVDPTGNMYVTNSESNSITVFPPTAGANTTPSAVIASPNAVVNPTGVAIDSTGQIYVANAGAQIGDADSITTYPPASNAGSEPSEIIGGGGSGDLSMLSDPSAVAVFSSTLFGSTKTFIAVTNLTGGYQGNGSVNLYVSPSGAPFECIAGTAAGDVTGLSDPVAAVASEFYVYVLNSTGGPDQAGSVTVYPIYGACPTNPTPSRTIANSSPQGGSTQFQSPAGMALDSSNNIYVTNDGSIGGNPDSITIYPAGSNGDVAPSAVISGSNTGLNMPQGIATDNSGNIYVANNGSANGGVDTVTVYSRGSTGNVAPIATISGSATGLAGPTGLAVGP
jgi:hypothetical protein